MIYVVDAASPSRFEDSKSALGMYCWLVMCSNFFLVHD